MRIDALGAKVILNLPEGVARLLCGTPTQDGARTLDPRLQLLLAAGAASKQPRFCDLGVEGARRHYERVVDAGEAPEPTLAYEVELSVAGMKARFFHPTGRRSELPCIVYLHGGGFVIGGIGTHLHVARRISRASGCALLLLDYPLAPESPFPAALDHCARAIDEVRERRTPLAIDPSRLALAGDSAGANLSAVLGPKTNVQAQLLYYPATDAGADSGSRRTAAHGFGLETDDVNWFTRQYAPSVPMREPRLSPRWSDDLAGSPPTRLVLAGFDPLRDEGRRFGRALMDAGAYVELVEESELIHGFVHMGRLRRAADVVHRDGKRLGDLLRTGVPLTAHEV
ncbi:MAG: alpha/beta hydrolase [Myxococcota bacterium]